MYEEKSIEGLRPYPLVLNELVACTTAREDAERRHALVNEAGRSARAGFFEVPLLQEVAAVDGQLAGGDVLAD